MGLPLSAFRIRSYALLQLHHRTPVAVCYTSPNFNSWADLIALCLYMRAVRKD